MEYVMQQDYSNMGEEDVLEEEKEEALETEESAKKLKAILFVVLSLLVTFLIFTYYFLRMIEANKIS